MAHAPLKVVVIDDDPTGSQTVHSCPLLLRWDEAALRRALRAPSPLLFLLGNTRALDPASARERIRAIGTRLRPLLEEECASGRLGSWLVVSRGDSTLRSHFPLEVEELSATLGPFAATLLAPPSCPADAPPWTVCTGCTASPCTPRPLPAMGCSAIAPASCRTGWRRKAVGVCRPRRCGASPGGAGRGRRRGTGGAGPAPAPGGTAGESGGGGGCGAAAAAGGPGSRGAGAHGSSRGRALGAAAAVPVPVRRQPAQRPGGAASATAGCRRPGRPAALRRRWGSPAGPGAGGLPCAPGRCPARGAAGRTGLRRRGTRRAAVGAGAGGTAARAAAGFPGAGVAGGAGAAAGGRAHAGAVQQPRRAALPQRLRTAGLRAGAGGPDGAAGGRPGAPAGLSDQQGRHHHPHPAGRGAGAGGRGPAGQLLPGCRWCSRRGPPGPWPGCRSSPSRATSAMRPPCTPAGTGWSGAAGRRRSPRSFSPPRAARRGASAASRR